MRSSIRLGLLLRGGGSNASVQGPFRLGLLLRGGGSNASVQGPLWRHPRFCLAWEATLNPNPWWKFGLLPGNVFRRSSELWMLKPVVSIWKKKQHGKDKDGLRL